MLRRIPGFVIPGVDVRVALDVLLALCASSEEPYLRGPADMLSAEEARLSRCSGFGCNRRNKMVELTR